MIGRIQMDTRDLDRARRCAVVAETLALLRVEESLYLTLDQCPDCLERATQDARPDASYALEFLEFDRGVWKMRVRRMAGGMAGAAVREE